MQLIVNDVINQIKEIAKKNQSRESSQKTRFVTEDKIKVGECFRQGDLYIWKVEINHPVGEEIVRNQLADGISLGARHVLNGDFKIYKGIKSPFNFSNVHIRAGALGYAFDASETTVLGHPEHDNFVFKSQCRWQVTHQIDSRTLQRVGD